MLSTPPPMAASAPSCTIWCAAMAMACRPDEQKRLTVVAAVETGSPASSADTRATFWPCDAVRLAATEDHVFDFVGVELRGLAKNVPDAMGGQVVGPRHVEGAAK